ncbi:protein phosphatase CheZ [Pseudohongiella sp. SYSU M77423]|uniref:protein phosphatase CheZ n=1 Tax=Pseudohongiella sp. SYSU M77423 TaxID=3042312 RepID=UPI0024808904|nr:protein phosphatase CheZ [Pseudohongiella sp. SYSU M77423]MDH7942992.1 protein phosphatase CheZ [Pseudohongiella sp. SYSU M77423]
MAEIDQERYELLYREVGRLTRALHNAIRDFHVGINVTGSAEVEHELSEMADARSRLNYVIKMTEEAANKTMDRVDDSIPIIQSMVEQSNEVGDRWAQYVASRSCSDDEKKLFEDVSGLLSRVNSEGSGLHGNLTDILMAQGFQDLSGQVIKRVIGLVSDVEKSLVNLVKLASSVEEVAGIERVVQVNDPKEDAERRLRAEGPQTKTSQDVVSGQDDVDDLLSSLGF